MIESLKTMFSNKKHQYIFFKQKKAPLFLFTFFWVKFFFCIQIFWRILFVSWPFVKELEELLLDLRFFPPTSSVSERLSYLSKLSSCCCHATKQQYPLSSKRSLALSHGKRCVFSLWKPCWFCKAYFMTCCQTLIFGDLVLLISPITNLTSKKSKGSGYLWLHTLWNEYTQRKQKLWMCGVPKRWFCGCLY